jgi:stage II sporulation protein D
MLSRTIWIACLVIARPASAEEEVRILIGETDGSFSVSGVHLAVFDADSGDRLYAWSERGSAEVGLESRTLVVRSKSGRVAKAKHLVFEADEAVSVDRGIYFGRIEARIRERSILVINRLPLETYLLGIVGSEMSPEWPIEALKAQAVAARTYAMQRRMAMRAADKPYDLSSTVLSQVYKGAERIRPSVVTAVAETRGEVLAFRRRLAEALFHSTCGGRTVSAGDAFGRDVPYLKPQSCAWCRGSSRHRWTITMPVSEMSKRLERAHLVKGSISGFDRDVETSAVQVMAGRKSQRLSPKKVREAVGFSDLYSSRFTAETRGKTIHIHGRGFGHGVGMCQWGAKGMADAGRTYGEILQHYYRSVAIRRLY